MVSERAGDFLSASASANQRRVHGTATFGRKLNNNPADMDCHAVPPQDNAGGNSKREELCQQKPEQLTITATGASSSSGRPEAPGTSSSGRLAAMSNPLRSGGGKVYPQANTGGERYSRKFDDPAKSL